MPGPIRVLFAGDSSMTHSAHTDLPVERLTGQALAGDIVGAERAET